MDLKDYFENTTGIGILSTADSQGNVDAAIYSRPHFMEDGTLAFIMRDSLSHNNLQSNPHAIYLFVEKGAGYNGKRLYITKEREEKNSKLLASLQRRKTKNESDKDRFVVFFKFDRERPLVGDSMDD